MRCVIQRVNSASVRVQNEKEEKIGPGLQQRGVPVKTGIFQAYMKVILENDGPVTLILDSKRGP